MLLHSKARVAHVLHTWGRRFGCPFNVCERNISMTRIFAIALTASMAVQAASASAAGLASEKEINDGLLVIAAADKIRRECNGISGRLFRAQGYANELKAAARAKGYSDAEIDAYINNKQARATVRGHRNAYFTSKGASNLDAQSLCVLGYQEIAQKTQIGSLLRKK